MATWVWWSSMQFFQVTTSRYWLAHHSISTAAHSRQNTYGMVTGIGNSISTVWSPTLYSSIKKYKNFEVWQQPVSNKWQSASKRKYLHCLLKQCLCHYTEFILFCSWYPSIENHQYLFKTWPHLWYMTVYMYIDKHNHNKAWLWGTKFVPFCSIFAKGTAHPAFWINYLERVGQEEGVGIPKGCKQHACVWVGHFSF